MGVLERADGARRIALGGRVLAGRGERCDLRLASPRASGEHAVLTWRDGGWHVRDLGSRNGTLIDGEPLALTDDLVCDRIDVDLINGTVARVSLG